MKGLVAPAVCHPSYHGVRSILRASRRTDKQTGQGALGEPQGISNHTRRKLSRPVLKAPCIMAAIAPCDNRDPGS